jgi:hypothetical protein
LLVVGEATGTTSSDVADPFRELGYRWNFGDTGSDYDTVYGPVAGHVYETAGSYTVTLEVKQKVPLGEDAEGAVTHDVTTFTVTVSDADTAYAGVKTVCVSTSGTFTGAPAGHNPITSADFDAVMTAHAAADKRILFRVGEVFEASAVSTCTIAANPCQLGKFGTNAGSPDARGCYADDPLIKGLTDVNVLDPRGPDWRITNLRFTSTTPGANTVMITPQRTADDMLIYKCQSVGNPGSFIDIDFFTYDAFYGDGVGYPDGWGVHNCNIGCNRWGIWSCGTKSSVTNNYFSTPTGDSHEHSLRQGHSLNGSVYGNTFETSVISKHNIKLHGVPWATHAMETEYVVISHNIINMGSDIDYAVAVAPQDASSNERLRYVLVEANQFIVNSRKAYTVYICGDEISCRNNDFIFGAGAAGGYAHVCHCSVRGVELAPVNVYVQNNSCYSAVTNGRLYIFAPGYYTGTAFLDNNILYAPSASGTALVTKTCKHASRNNLIGTDPSFTAASTNDLTLLSTSVAIGAGYSNNLLLDYDDAFRGDQTDQGAHEHSGATWSTWALGDVIA